MVNGAILAAFQPVIELPIFKLIGYKRRRNQTFVAAPITEDATVVFQLTVDFSANVSFNSERNQLSLTLVDGGTGDDDGEQNGIIEDPSGLGVAPADSASTNINSSGGGSGGCFIDTLGNSINWWRF
jgi:hypothetical protein